MSDAKAKKETGKYYEAVGRRKTSVARVRIYESAGKFEIIVNDKKNSDYFPTAEMKEIIHQPIKTIGGADKFKITAKITGGGIHSQAEALRHAISRALVKVNPENRKVLKPEKLLSRDSRMKERRKFGLKKARKSPQWSKR